MMSAVAASTSEASWIVHRPEPGTPPVCMLYTSVAAPARSNAEQIVRVVSWNRSKEFHLSVRTSALTELRIRPPAMLPRNRGTVSRQNLLMHPGKRGALMGTLRETRS